MRFVALDIDKNTVLATFMGMDGAVKLVQKRFGTDPSGLAALIAALDKDDRVVMEACHGSRWLAGRLLHCVENVELVNPIEFGKLLDFFGHKTDRNDSGLLCRLFRVDELPTVWMPDPMTWEDREFTAHRTNLDKDRTRLRNRIHALFTEHGLGTRTDKLLKMDPQALLVEVNTQLPVLARDILGSLLRQLGTVESELRMATATIVDRTSKNLTARPETINVAVTLPGVADWLAFTMAAYIGDPLRFKTAGSLPNFAGLVPRLYSSGPGTPRHGHITRRGCAPLRWAAIEAANNARKVPGRFRDLYQRVYRRSKSHGKAVVACARELLHVLWHLLRKKEAYRDLPSKARERKESRRKKSAQDAQKFLQHRPDTRSSILNNLGPVYDTLQVLAR